MQKQDRRSLKMFYVLDSNGEPRKADVFEWAEFLEECSRERPNRSQRARLHRVSRDRLQLFWQGRPLAVGNHGVRRTQGGDLWRFSSQAEAIQFHYALVADLRTKGRGVQ